MGFSTSAAAGIIFIGVLVSLSIVYPAATGSFEKVNDAIDDRDDRALRERNSGFALENATYNSTANTVTLNATNTGTVTLSANATDVLVDGTVYPNATLAVDGVTGRSLWAPGEVLTMTVESVPSVPNRVTVVAETGVSRANSSVAVV